MALRIESLLIFILLLLFLSILTINPKSQSAISSMEKRDVEFHNFALYEIQTRENGYEVSSKEAIYEDENISMHPFLLKFNSHTLKGDNLRLNINNQIVSADNIEATITLE